MATGTIKKTSRMLVQRGAFENVGVSNDWSYTTVTFPTAYKKQPMVSVSLGTTRFPTTDADFMLDNITTTGFRFGRYATGSTREYWWQAIGEVD